MSDTINGQTLQQAQEQARQDALKKGQLTEAWRGPGEYKTAGGQTYNFQNYNQYNNYAGVLDRQAHDAADIARYHWQTQYKSEQGYNLPALRQGVPNPDEASTSDGSRRAGAPTGQQVFANAMEKEAFTNGGKGFSTPQAQGQAKQATAAQMSIAQQNAYSPALQHDVQAFYERNANAGAQVNYSNTLSSGSQQRIYQGANPAKNAGELITRLQGRPFQPSIAPSNPQLQNRVVGVVKGNTLDFGKSPIVITDEKTGTKTFLNTIPLSSLNDNGVSSGKVNGASPIPDSNTSPQSQATEIEQKGYFQGLGEGVRDLAVGAERSIGKVGFIVGSVVAPGIFEGRSPVTRPIYEKVKPAFLNTSVGQYAKENFYVSRENVLSDPDIRNAGIASIAIPIQFTPAAPIVDFGIVGLSGYSFIKNPTAEQGGKSTVQALVGLSGRVLRNAPSKEVVEVSPFSGGAAKTVITESSVESTQTLLGAAKVQGESVPVSTNAILRGERIPSTDYFNVRVETQSAIPVKGGTQYIPQDFLGVYNARTNVLSIGNKEFYLNQEGGRLYFAQGGKSEPAMFDTVSTIERAPTRFTNLELSGKDRLPVVSNTGRAGTLAETYEVQKIPYQGADGVNVFGAPQASTVVESNTGYVTLRTGGANTDLFRGGFQNLERSGLYKDPYFVQGNGMSILESRRGAVLENSPRVIPQTPEANVPMSSTPKSPGVIDLSGLQVTGEVSVPRASPTAFPVYSPTMQRQSVRQTLISAPPKEDETILSPTSSPDTVLSLSTTTQQDSALLNTPVQSPVTSATTEQGVDTLTQSTTDQATSSATSTETDSALKLTQDSATQQKTAQSQTFELRSSLQSNVFTGTPSELPIGTPLAFIHSGSKKPWKKYDLLTKRQGKFKLEAANLDLPGAAAAGERFADSTLGASFEVVEHGTSTPIPANVVRDFVNKQRYAPSKRDSNVLVQMPKFRLSSQSERSEIHFAKSSFSNHQMKGGRFRL